VRPPDQEPDELPLGKLLFAVFATITVFGIGVAAAAAALTGRHLTTVPPPETTIHHSLVEVSAPGLERSSAVRLDRFGWVDRDAGVARIPIDRAIDLTLKDRR